MKLKFAILFFGVLAIASGCARKCPPCPTCGGYASSGTGLYAGSAANASAPVAASKPVATGSYAADSSARYVKK